VGGRAGIGVGVIGLGFMGRTHVEAYARASEAGHANRLVAVCDRDADRRAGRGGTGGNFETGEGELFDPARVRGCETVDELLADDDVELVSVCTPTDTHVDVAIRALEAGKHVLVEKPVALRASEVERVGAAARAAERVAMPAMCVRFWPGWSDLKTLIETEAYGGLRSLSIQRLGLMPGWGEGFYADVERSGGALFDLHVHDSDLVAWCLGMPRGVFSTGSPMHLTTSYLYDGLHVTAEGAWDHRGEFVMRYAAAFEGATVTWSLGREAAMLVDTEKAQIEGESSELSGWDVEIRHLLDVIACGERLRATMDEAAGVIRLLEAERRSLETGDAVKVEDS